jgi:hypothetical protein
MQAFYLDESYYSATEWAILVSGYSTADGIAEKGFFDGLAAASRLFQNTRAALARQPVSHQETKQLLSRASALHQTLAERLSGLSEHLDRTRDFSERDMDVDTRKEKFIHGSLVRDYGLALSTQIVVNCIMAGLQGTWNDSAKSENAWLCQEICGLGEKDATYHQPLGSAWVLIALPVAYIGAYSAEDKTRVMDLLASYSNDLSPSVMQIHSAGLEDLVTYLSCTTAPSRHGRKLRGTRPLDSKINVLILLRYHEGPIVRID